MQAPQPTITIAHLQGYPFLRSLAERWIDARGQPKTCAHRMEMWQVKGFSFPAWLAPFNDQRPRVCTRLNHRKAGGCDKQPACNMEHVCMLCGRPGHGVFFRLHDSGSFQCCQHEGLYEDLDRLRQRHSGLGSTLTEFVQAVTRGCVGRASQPLATRPPAPTMTDTAQFPPLGARRPAPVAPWARSASLVCDRAPAAPSPQVSSSGHSSPPTSVPSESDPVPASVFPIDVPLEEEPEEEFDDLDIPTLEVRPRTIILQDNADLPESIILIRDEAHRRGSSEYAHVYRATHRFVVDTEVAVKLWVLTGEPKVRRLKMNQLKSELKSLSKLAGSNCVVNMILNKTAVDLQDDFQYAMLVMEFCPQNLLQYVQDVSTGAEGIPTNDPVVWREQLYSIVHQLLVAYYTCHKEGVYQRDVKPENILIAMGRRMDGAPLIKLCDFGLSRHFDVSQSSSKHQSNSRVGTIDMDNMRCWVASEVDAARPTGAPYKVGCADVWSLGCVIYFVATKGEALFRTPMERDDGQRRERFLHRHGLEIAHPLLLDLIDGMTQADPGRRISMSDALHHPATWDDRFVCSVLCDLANAFNKGEAVACQRAIDASASEILPHGLDWTTAIPPVWMSQIRHQLAKDATTTVVSYFDEQGNGARPTQLLRWLRNLHEHARNHRTFYHHEQQARERELGKQERVIFVETVVKSFPRLLPLLFKIIQHQYGLFQWSPQSGFKFSLHKTQ